MANILIVDDDGFARSGLRLYLGALGHHSQEAGDVQTAWGMALNRPPDAAIIDIRLPLYASSQYPKSAAESHGIGLAARLKEAYPTMGIVLLSAHQQYEKQVQQLTQKFMRGIAFLHKGGDMSRLGMALQEVLDGRMLFQGDEVNKYVLATAVSSHFSDAEAAWIELALREFGQLSPREQEVAHLLSASHTPEHIAQRLGLSKGSVDNLISRVYNRLGLADMKDEELGLRPLPILVKACLLYDIQNNH